MLKWSVDRRCQLTGIAFANRSNRHAVNSTKRKQKRKKNPHKLVLNKHKIFYDDTNSNHT